MVGSRYRVCGHAFYYSCVFSRFGNFLTERLGYKELRSYLESVESWKDGRQEYHDRTLWLQGIKIQFEQEIIGSCDPIRWVLLVSKFQNPGLLRPHHSTSKPFFLLFLCNTQPPSFQLQTGFLCQRTWPQASVSLFPYCHRIPSPHLFEVD